MKLNVAVVAVVLSGSALAASSRPQNIARAVPARAQQLLFVEPIRGNLEPALDLLERLLGHAAADEFLNDAPLPLLGLNAAAGIPIDEHGVNPEGGLGLFRLPDFEGVIGLVASQAPKKTQAAVRAQLVEQQSKQLRSISDAERWHSPALGDVYLFSTRGFVYLVMGELPGDGSTAEQEGTLKVVRELQQPTMPPLADASAWKILVATAAEGTNVGLFATSPAPLFLNLETDDNRAKLSGFILTEANWQPAPTKANNPLSGTEGNPVVVGSIWLAPAATQLLASGSQSSPSELDALLNSLGDRLTFALHIDAEPKWLNVLNGVLLPYNRVTADVALKAPEPLLNWMQKLLGETGVPVRIQRTNGTKRLSARIPGDELTVDFSARGARLSLGERRSSQKVNLLSELRRRFGPETFGPGHASLLVDLDMLRRKLLEPIDLSGMSEEEAQLLQELALAWVWQLDPIHYLFADLAAEKNGLRVRGEIRFHGQEQEARRQ